MKDLIPGYPAGSELILLDTIYYKSKRQEDGKYSKDALTLILKDPNKNIKFQHTMIEPTYEFYVAKDDVPIDHNMLFIEYSKVNLVTVKYNNLLKELATISDNLEFYYDNLKSRNSRANNILFTYKRVFNADMDIEDNIRFRFNRTYRQPIVPITKSYFDIEVDTKHMALDFPELGECPINAVTILNDNTGSKRTDVYTLLLREDTNPLIAEFERSIGTASGFRKFMGYVKNKLLASCDNNPDTIKKLGLDDLNIKVRFYDDEMELIQDTIGLFHMINADYILAWNMSFDIPYIIERIRALGYIPEDIMSHPDFPIKSAYYFEDKFTMEGEMKNHEDRGDFARISSYSVFLDQLIHFTSRRKGTSKFKTNKLDYIGEVIAGIKKLDYSHITRNIATLCYDNYKIFTVYNIIDTLVLKGIEKKTGDIEFVARKSAMNNTRYSKVHRQTIYLTNRTIKEFYAEGFVIGNNVNKFKPKPTEKFVGAVVGDPLNFEQDYMLTIHGIDTRLLANADDFDFSSLYPSIMDEFNLAPNTEIARIIMVEHLNSDFNPFGNDKYTTGGSFIEDYISENIIEFCRRWFGAPDIKEMICLVKEYFDNTGNKDQYGYYDYKTGLVSPFYIDSAGYSPFEIIKEEYNPFFISTQIPERGYV